jgi:hypothetical protein
MVLAVALAAAAARAVTLSLPELALDSAEGALTISVDDATGLQGVDLDVTYDPAVVQVAEAQPTAMTAGCMLVSNPAPAGLLRVSLACMQPLNGGGAFLTIPIEGRQVGISTVDITRCTINEESVPCSTAEGVVSVRRAQARADDNTVGALRVRSTAQ